MADRAGENAAWQDTPEKEAWRALVAPCAQEIAERFGITERQMAQIAGCVLAYAYARRDSLSVGESEPTFTADEVVEIANETSDSLGNLYRLDFIDRIRHETEERRSLPGGGDSDG